MYTIIGNCKGVRESQKRKGKEMAMQLRKLDAATFGGAKNKLFFKILLDLIWLDTSKRRKSTNVCRTTATKTNCVRKICTSGSCAALHDR